MTGSKYIEDALVEAGIPQRTIYLLDEDYALPAPEWITDHLAASLNKMLADAGISYVPERFDCNHFAKAASAIADWCWATSGQEESALAFGLFGFYSQQHAINIAVHRDPEGGLRVAFYEPQPTPNESGTSLVCLTPVTLFKEDLASAICCWFY